MFRDERFSFFFRFKRENPIILFLIFLPSVRDRSFHFCPVNYSNRQLTIIVFERNSDRVVPSYRAVRYYLSRRKLHSSKNYRFFFLSFPFFFFFYFSPLYATAWDVSRGNYSSVLCAINGILADRRENRSVNLSRIVESLLGGITLISIRFAPFFFFFVDKTKREKNDFLNIKNVEIGY